MRPEDNDLLRRGPFAHNIGDLHAVCREHLALDDQAVAAEFPLNVSRARGEALGLFANTSSADVARDALHVLAKAPADLSLLGGQRRQRAGKRPARKFSEGRYHPGE